MRTPLIALIALIAVLGLATAPACAQRGPATAAASIDTAPFALRLTGARDAGAVVLTAELDLAWPLATPITLTVELPPGASLAQGAAREVVTAPRPGATLVRRYRALGVGAGTIRVRAEQRHGDLAGALATRTWPTPTEPAAPTFVKIAPAHLGSLTLEQAIPLTPNRER